jgi:hypothetical protein
MSDYWLARDGQQLGPYSLEELQRRQVQGLAAATDLAWTEGMAEWEPLSKVLAARRSPAPPPPPPAPQIMAPYPSPLPASPGSKLMVNYPTPAAGVDSNLIPPSLHWALVLLFSFLSLGIFSWVWSLNEASYAKRLEGGKNAQMLMIIAVVGQVAYYLVFMGTQTANYDDVRVGLSLFEFICSVGGLVVFYVAVFQIRRALLTHFNTTEPIGLRLSGAMTFFFTILYLQYHLTRIAKWKRTGILDPQ